MSIYVFYTEIWSCIRCKRSTCSMRARSRDTCFFGTAVIRRSSVIAFGAGQYFCLVSFWQMDRWWKLVLHFFLIQSLLISEQVLKQKFSHISENFRAGNTLLAQSSRCLTSKNSAFIQSGGKYLFLLGLPWYFSCADLMPFSFLFHVNNIQPPAC